MGRNIIAAYSPTEQRTYMSINLYTDKVYSKDEYNEETEQYTYTFDKDGYVESCTEVSTYKRLDIDDTRTETTIYTFKWE